MVTKSDNKNLWYMRRGNEIRGPFPAGMISRYILLGRIVESDELSVDQLDWKFVNEFPELIPAELKVNLSDEENQEKLRLARIREDERTRDRRQHENYGADLPDEIRRKRSGEDRRDDESYEIKKHREVREKLLRLTSSNNPENYSVRVLLLLVMLAAVVWVGFSQKESQKVNINYCDAEAKPNVNWNHCHLEGAQLENANLAGARLHSAYLPGAMLFHAVLTDSNLSYANLVNADLRNAKMNGVISVGTQYRNADLSGADFSDAKLKFAIMHGANLSDAQFVNADLTHVDLSGAEISNADFSGAKLDKVIWVDNSVCAPESIGECIPVIVGKK